MDNKCFYKFDISQAYQHIDIDDNYQKYVGKIIYFMFIVLPFSFSSAPFIFTKVMPCLVKILEKVRDKKFAYLLTTVSLDLVQVRKKQLTIYQCSKSV